MSHLIILNEAPYGSERSYNGLRLAVSLSKQDSTAVSVFLMGDAAACAMASQETPNGYYNIERMLKLLVTKGARVGICGTCMDVRGIRPELLVEGTRRSTLDELTTWTQGADRVLVF